MAKQFVIWDSCIDLNNEKWQEAIKEDKELNPEFWEDADEYLEMEWCHNENEMELEMLQNLLNVDLDNPILIIADLGLWDGRKSGYRLIESGSLREILQPSCSGQSEVCWYFDGEDIKCEEIHHDGTNHYLYREVRNPDEIDRFLAMIYHQLDYSPDTLDRYTKPLAKDIKKILGID